MAKIGRSLPNLVRRYHRITSERITKFLCLSDGDDETPRVLLTGGLLVRIQPEEPIPRFARSCLLGLSSRSIPPLGIRLAARKSESSPRSPITEN